MSTKVVATCPRCGIVRQISGGKKDGLCGDCRYVEPKWPDVEVMLAKR